jgi:hypothetical protein
VTNKIFCQTVLASVVSFLRYFTMFDMQIIITMTPNCIYIMALTLTFFKKSLCNVRESEERYEAS